MKSIMAEINRLTSLLYDKINADKTDEIMSVLNERFKLIKDLLKTRESSNYLVNLLQQDEIMMQKVQDQQRNIKIHLGNMDKLTKYKM